ncbi:hypothetical protein [Halalkalibacterium halodurans]|uniref:hypothetical protein n=1 Tax=Halalkalibacterium halodurans TaxID=86665 RepID=UPI002AAA0F73|nr:hypothetical protein [Halalkalibacterium halodurans]MDY7223743.1 hypothetical protein [Halalkalibacterium halodurans]MDY7242964.1 hypothetical protein [Halalkalibacterium halodurans]
MFKLILYLIGLIVMWVFIIYLFVNNRRIIKTISKDFNKSKQKSLSNKNIRRLKYSLFYEKIIIICVKFPVIFWIIILGIFLCTFVCLFNVVPELIEKTINVSELCKLSEFIYVIDFLNKLIGIFLSIGLTAALFVYREQRILATNNTILRKYFVVTAFKYLFVALTYVYGYFLLNKANEQNFIDARIAIWALLLITSVILLMFIFDRLLKNVNLEKLTKDRMEEFRHSLISQTFLNITNIKLTSHEFVFLFFNNIRLHSLCPTFSEIHFFSNWAQLIKNKKEKQLKKMIHLIDYLIYNVESTYQLLSVTLDKRMMDAFFRNSKNWENIIDDLRLGLELEKGKKTKIIPFEVLPHCWKFNKEDYFSKLYVALLEGHLSIIRNLTGQKRFDLTSKWIKVFFDSYTPSTNFDNSLRAAYISKVQTHLTIAYNEDSIEYKKVLKEVEKEYSKSEKEEFYKIYENLMYKIVEEDDITNLTHTVYSLIRPLTDLQPKSSDKDLSGRMQNSISKKVSPVDLKNLSEDLLNVIIKITIKSVEISNYRCTGLLIKFMVTNFNKVIKEALLKIKDNSSKIHFEEENESYESNSAYYDIGFNSQTFMYCLNKLTLLVFLQQNYANEERLEFITDYKDSTTLLTIEDVKLNCSYANYLYRKIKRSGDKYGLSFLRDTTFQDRISEKLETKVIEIVKKNK